MADTKITALAAITTVAPANDLFAIVDVSDNSMAASGTTKNITTNQILGAGGTATLASATITGDLTVDTSTLKVDSANDRVGIGTASPAQFVHLSKSNTSTALTSPPVGGASLRIQNTSSTNNNFGSVEFYNAAGLFGASVNCQYTNQATPTNDLVFVTRGSSGGLEHYRIAADGVCTWSEVGGVAGTAMTLNSTGLGVGVVPSAGKFEVQESGTGSGIGGIFTSTVSGGGNPGVVFRTASTNRWSLSLTGSAGAESIRFYDINNSATRLLIDTSGNVGIGVTPKPWRSGARALQLGANGYVTLNEQANGNANLCFAAYEGSANVFNYTTTGDLPSRYVLVSGTHQWYTAPSGTAGNAITFTEVMRLDASGNLLVAGTSAYIRAGGRTQIVGGSVVDINTVGNNVGIAFGGASSILPCDGSSTTTDGVANFGSASKRWNTIYASTGTINTSDQNEKQDIADLGDAEKRVAGKIKSLVKKYRFKDAVASKGENARIHVGWIAQDVQNAFSSEGLDASKYGVFCSDTWEENGVQKTRLGLRYDEVIAFVVSAI